MSLDPSKIKARREKLGLTQTEAAERAGLLQPNWARIEGGQHTDPTLSTALAIAKALRCKVESLVKPSIRKNPKTTS